MQIQEVTIMEQKYTVDARGEQCPNPVKSCLVTSENEIVVADKTIFISP